jgi:hypothetical protein
MERSDLSAILRGVLPAIHPAAFHPLTPGNPAYAIAKISAVGGLIGLRVAMSRRSKRAAEAESATAPAVEQHAAARPHPVSSRKARRRSRKRR